jgi:hypothetical protein
MLNLVSLREKIFAWRNTGKKGRLAASALAAQTPRAARLPQCHAQLRKRPRGDTSALA